jgi:hypothetical protein
MKRTMAEYMIHQKVPFSKERDRQELNAIMKEETMDERNVGVDEILVVLVCDDGTTETIPVTDVTYKQKYEYDYPQYTVSASGR